MEDFKANGWRLELELKKRKYTARKEKYAYL
jgi:hypothetical protein